MKLTLSLSLIIFLIIGVSTRLVDNLPAQIEKPKISFSFDDGSTNDYPGYKLEEWNQLILDNLEKYNLKAAFFITGSRLNSHKGKYMLTSWDNAGHKIGNHSYTHPNFNNEEVTTNMMSQEILKNDSVIREYKNYFPYFRFPYLKEGNTVIKRDGIREFMAGINYKNGYVTVDASDWYVNSRLVRKMREDSDADLTSYKNFYIQHLYERALFYDSLATDLTNRKINHVLLLHHNLTSALFLDDLIQHFKNQGWDVIDTDIAYKDPIFSTLPDILPAGESLIWAMAKETGKYENVLRYPAEDSEYEKEKMDELGL